MSILDVIALPDTHVPFHDEWAWELALKIVQDVQPAYVIHLGDLGDFHALASHPKKFGREEVWPKEKVRLQSAVGELVEASRSRRLRRRVWLQGNHEERYERYVADKAPQIEEDVPSGRELLKLPKQDVWVPYRQSIDLGKVTFAHDIGHAGKTATYQNLQSAGRNIVTGHTHSAGIEWGGTTHGDGHFALSAGWLGDKEKITYLHRSQMKSWRHGIAHLHVEEGTGFVWPSFIPFVNYSAVVNGKRYTVSAKRAA